jgi:hypothetical protein
MKRTLLYLSFSLVTIAQMNRTQAQTADSNDRAIAMLKDFYTNYITLIASDSNTDKQQAALQKRYCTAKLLKKLPKMIEAEDADPFLKAQDSQVDFLKTLKVKRDVKMADHYTVSYAGVHKHVINLTVVKADDSYKIDSVW